MMDDPWDVKSVRQTGDYISLLKINGVPLLPPILSKECRKEMQYYKLLAKEVEKRISVLQPYVNSNTDSDNVTDASEIPDNEEYYDKPSGDANGIIIDEIHVKTETDSTSFSKIQSNTLEHTTDSIKEKSFKIDLNLCVNQAVNLFPSEKNNKNQLPIDLEVPERDDNCKTIKSPIKELDIETNPTYKTISNKDEMPDLYSPLRSGPQSLSSKTFTGSLDDIYKESLRSSCTLTRQRSYTLLEPSPVLLAHLEIQSLNTGVEVNCISMSESLSNLTPSKKRRSWDLESAKVKWSNMALELKQKDITKIKPIKNEPVKPAMKRPQDRAKSLIVERRRASVSSKTPVSEPVHRNGKSSPVRNIFNTTVTKEPSSPKTKATTPEPRKPTAISAAEDPATKVRELYDKIQQQQLIQMASLVEKQKREQLLLQQVFEEQNNLLFRQLKTICPKSPIEVKEAWGDKSHGSDRGPVSLSQLINPRSPDRSSPSSPTSPTTTSTYKDHKNKNMAQNKRVNRISNGNRARSPSVLEGSRTRTHSPSSRNPARKLNYESSVSSGRECELLTDRTNDTMADLNVTFPSDTEEFSKQNSSRSDSQNSQRPLIVPPPNRSTDLAIRSMEQAIHKSMGTCRRKNETPPTKEQREAASRIVAYCKGYLVRRLLRTERVQSTVQTLRDALLCALQLHRDRDGIRGADVDLHRRLIQQITAACYSLHDTFITSTPAERCAMIAADRGRRRSLANRPPPKPARSSDVMSQSHSGAFPSRPKRVTPTLMTQSSYEMYTDKCGRTRYMPSPRRRPWR